MVSSYKSTNVLFTILLLQAHNLFGHVDGSTTVPPMLTADAIGIIIPNSGDSFWYHKGKLIISALISYLTEGLLLHALSLESSIAVWQTLDLKHESCRHGSNLPP
jgi:hypothetical protein